MMLTLWTCASLAAVPVGLDRVDLIAEDPGTFFNYDLPTAPYDPQTAAIRFGEQIKFVWYLPVEGLYIGTSLSSQSLSYELRLWERKKYDSWYRRNGFYAQVGLQTSLLMPRGVYGGVSWRYGVFRLAVGGSAISSSSWARPNFNQWHVLPTIGIGFTRYRYQEILKREQEERYRELQEAEQEGDPEEAPPDAPPQEEERRPPPDRNSVFRIQVPDDPNSGPRAGVLTPVEDPPNPSGDPEDEPKPDGEGTDPEGGDEDAKIEIKIHQVPRVPPE